MASEVAPDVIVMDVIMPGKGGVDAFCEIIDVMPDIRVLMLTASTAPDVVIEAISAGASGYLLKDSGVDELVGTIQDIAEGRVNLTAGALQRAATMIRKETTESRSPGGGVIDRKGDGDTAPVLSGSVVHADSGRRCDQAIHGTQYHRSDSA